MRRRAGKRLTGIGVDDGLNDGDNRDAGRSSKSSLKAPTHQLARPLLGSRAPFSKAVPAGLASERALTGPG